jgi:hypothetical protein
VLFVESKMPAVILVPLGMLLGAVVWMALTIVYSWACEWMDGEL